MLKGQSARVTSEPYTCDWCICVQQSETLVGRKGRQNSKTGNSVYCASFGHADARAAERTNLPTDTFPNPTSKFSGSSLIDFHLNCSGLAGHVLWSKGDELCTAVLFAVTSSQMKTPGPYNLRLTHICFPAVVFAAVSEVGRSCRTS
jgi:hypothetical protein